MKVINFLVSNEPVHIFRDVVSIPEKNDKAHFGETFFYYVKKAFTCYLEITTFNFYREPRHEMIDDYGRTCLHYAAESNDVSDVQQYIDENYKIDDPDVYGHTPLMFAVRNANFEAAKLLINVNASVFFRDEYGRGLLQNRLEFKKNCRKFGSDESALWDTYARLIKMILEKLRNDCWNNEQLLISSLRDVECSLIQAMYLGDANVTRLMLENGYSIDERELETDDTALHKAVELGDFENVKVLLEHGARVGAKNKDELSPIYLYNRSSRDVDEKVKILKILIDHGALLTPASESRMIPSESILHNGKLWAINTLMQYNVKWNPQSLLYALVSNYNSDVLEAVRGKNIDVNSVDNPMKSPVLSLAAEFGKLEKVQFLLEHGADPNVADANGRTPLVNVLDNIFTLEKQHLSIIQLLLQHGADAQDSFDNELTIFSCAIQRDREYFVKPVIAHLAMIESRGETISALICSHIESHEAFKIYFEKCRQQLETMKNTAIYESVTLHKLLTKSLPVITKYARNNELFSKFQEMMKVQRFLNPYYSISLRKRVGKAVHSAKLKEEAVVMFNNILDDHLKNYEILYEIVEYLNCSDLKNICKMHDLQKSIPLNLNTLFVL